MHRPGRRLTSFDVPGDPETFVALVVSSGTTGPRRLAVHTRGSLAAAMDATAAFARSQLGHSGPEAGGIAALASPGGVHWLLEVMLTLATRSALTVPPLVAGDRFDQIPEGTAVAVVSPSVLAARRPCNHLDGPGTLVLYGEGASDAVRAAWSVDHHLLDVYGSAEAGCPVAAGRDGRLHSLGSALVVLDPSGVLLPAGVVGELHVAAPTLAHAFLGAPATTAERFGTSLVGGRRARTVRTGDRARAMPDGTVVLEGRTDLRVADGHRVADPTRAESQIRARSGVLDAAAVIRGGHLTAFVTALPRPGEDDTRHWQEVFDHTYAGSASAPAGSDPDTVGWISSYTDEPIPAREMREWVAERLRLVRSRRPRRILEIGFGTGMLLVPLARECAEYWGTDLSATAVEHVSRRVGAAPGVHLRQAGADDLTGVPCGEVDLVLINSVIQYFPSQEYLRRVLEKAVDVVAPGGCVIVGDVRRLDLLQEFHLSTQLARATADEPGERVWRGALDRAITDEELVVHPDFFRRFALGASRPCTARLTAQRGPSWNEMTRFRFDACLDVDAQLAPEPAASVRDWSDAAEGDELPSWLTDCPAVLVRDVPDPRVCGIVEVADLARTGQLPRSRAGDLSAREREPGRAAVAMERLLAASATHGYDLHLLLGARPDLVDVAFVRTGLAPDRLTALVSAREQTLPPPRGWSRSTSDPSVRRREPAVRERVADSLRGRLPADDLPDRVRLVPALPLTLDGRVDRGALPETAQVGVDRDARPVSPRDVTEWLVARTWEEVLGVHPIGANDDFFALGGHSLVAMRAIARLQRQFGRRLELSLLLDHPTVSGMAEVLRSPEVDETRSPLVTLQDGRGRPPFFCFHPSGANALVYQHLAQELGPRRPVHMLCEHDVTRFASIEELAAHCLVPIREVAPRGPFLLGGLSFGGLVAFEAARQLADECAPVGPVVLFEASLRAPQDAIPEGDLLPYRTVHFAHVFELILGSHLDIVEEELAGLPEEAQFDVLFERARGAFDGDVGREMMARTVRQVRHVRQLIRAYRPRPYAGDVHLFIGREPMPPELNDPEFYRRDEALGWDDVCPALRLVSTSGNHLSLLSPPHVTELAARLEEILQPEEQR
jgi:thioesterase domain-containing protein/SAM-dependent methyltransferase